MALCPAEDTVFYLDGNAFIPSLAKLQQADPFEGKFLFDTKDFETTLKENCGDQFDIVQQWIRDALWTPTDKHFFAENNNWAKLAVPTDKDRYFEFLNKTHYAWCWFQSDNESVAMWNTHGKEGVAIATTVRDLSSALKATNYDFEFGKMYYYHRRARFSGTEKKLLALRPQFLKRIEYEHEKEVRFVATCAPETEGLLLNGVKPKTWIKQVRLWPGLISQEEDSLKTVIAKELPSVPCCKSDLMQTDGKAMSRMKEDLRAQAAKKAEQQWKKGEDGVPFILKNL